MPLSKSLAAGGLAILFWLGLTALANAQGAVRSVHGDWQIRCDTPPGAQNEQCALIQSVVAEDRSNAGLTVIVLKTAEIGSLGSWRLADPLRYATGRAE